MSRLQYTFDFNTYNIKLFQSQTPFLCATMFFRKRAESQPPVRTLNSESYPFVSDYAIGFISLISLALSQRATVCDEAGPYTFLPDVNDCSGWFFCGDNGPERGVCPAGRLFNPETRLCDFPHNVDCFRCPSNEGFNHFAMSGSCRSFVRCINGMPFQSVCEDRLQFNEKTGQCDFPDTVNCGSGFRCPSELPIDGTILAMRDNYNCSV